MGVLMRNYKAEIYQMLHSKLLIVHFVVPILGVIVFTSYYRYAPWKDLDQISGYLQIVAVAFPILVGIVMGIANEEERKAAQFQRILTVPYSKKIAHLSKFLALSTMGVISVLIAIVGFGMLAIARGNEVIGGMDYFKLAMLLFITHISWYTIEYIVGFNWGSGIAVGLGIVGGLLSPLLSFSLGDSIWQITPCAWGMRLIGYAFEMMKDDKNPLTHQIFEHGIRYMIIISLIIFLIFMIWSEKWQGLCRQEE